MKRRKKYLSIEEKRELIYSGKYAPICMSDSPIKESFIAKLRGSIFDDSLKNKRIKFGRGNR